MIYSVLCLATRFEGSLIRFVFKRITRLCVSTHRCVNNVSLVFQLIQLTYELASNIHSDVVDALCSHMCKLVKPTGDDHQSFQNDLIVTTRAVSPQFRLEKTLNHCLEPWARSGPGWNHDLLQISIMYPHFIAPYGIKSLRQQPQAAADMEARNLNL